MPIRKQNVDAFGKSWSPIDLPNLERAVKLYERLNYLQDHFAGSLSGTNKIMSQINEQAEIKEELQKLGIKHNEQELKQIIQLIQQRQNENRLMNTSYRGSTSGVINYHPTQSSYGPAINYYKPSNVNGQVNSSNLGNAVATSIMNRRMIQSEMDRMRAAGSIMSETSLRRAAQINVQNGNAVMTSELKNFGSKMDTVGSVFQVAVNTFSKAVNVFSGLFFKGLNNQARVYEDTFTNISVRTGTTRGRYFSEQTGMASRLYSSGLAGNIANSEVQQMWNKLAETGMGQEKIFANALETVLTQKIVPYLDASDKYFQQLYNENPNLMKQIRGIGRATNELEGSSEVVTEHLQDLIKDVSPLATLANQELGVQLAKSTGMYQNLRKQGMTDYEIRQYMGSTYQVYTDPLAALKSGNIDQALAVVNMLGNHADMDDYGVNTEYLLRSSNWVSNLIPEYANGQSKLLSGVLPSSVDNITRHRANMKNYDIEAAAAAGEAIAENLDLFGEKATSDYVNDVNNTLKQIQSNELENLSTWLAAIYEQIGYWGDIVSVLLKGIAGVVGAKVIGGIGKKILGLGGASGAGKVGLGAKIGANLSGAGMTGLGAAAGIAGGAAGIAAGVYGINKGNQQWAEARKGYNDSALQAGMGTANQLGGAAAIAGGTITAGVAVGAATGLIGAGAANAWNPVGWGLLIAGGVALLGAAIAESMDHATDANKMFDELQEQTNQEFRQKKLQFEQEMQTYYNYQAAIDQTTDVETAKRLAIQAGIATEEELSDSKYDEIDAVKDLVAEFINQKRKLSEDTLGTAQALKTVLNKEKSEFTADFLNKFVGNKYNIQSGDDTWAVNKYGQQIQAMAYDYLNQGLIEDKGNGKYEGQKDNEVAKHLAWMMEKGLLYHDYTDGNLTYDDYDILFTMGNSKDRRTVGYAMLNNDSYRNNILSSESARKIFGYKYGFRSDANGSQAEQLLSGLFAASADGDKEAVQKYVDQLKLLGYKASDFGSSQNTLLNALHNVGIESYRSGLSYVPYDDYIANLHEGEAVITAATANELRNLIVEYRESQQINTSLDTIIQNQTITLVNKIDEVIKVMQNDSLFPATAENTKLKNMFNNMRYMRTTKSFNQ